MRRLLSILWPPYGLYLAKRVIAQSANNEDPWTRVFEELRIDMPSQTDAELVDAEKLAFSVLEAEVKRKDVLESKAATFVVTPTVATAITAAIAPLTKDLGLSSYAATSIAICYILALIHLLVSSWYAIAARRAEAFVVLSPINARALMFKARNERVVALLAYARLNEPALLMKFNRLNVSEDLFLRGLAFLAVAACLTLMAHVAGV
jgi:hypothetical protein